MELVTPGFGLLFWMLLMFGIFLAILKKFAWKPILTALKNRERSIDEALRSADKAKEELLKCEIDNEKLLKTTEKQKEQILKEAKKIKDQIIEEAREKASGESAKMIRQAKIALEHEKEEAIEELRQQVALFSVEIAEKIMRHELRDDKQQKELINRILEDVRFN